MQQALLQEPSMREHAKNVEEVRQRSAPARAATV